MQQNALIQHAKSDPSCINKKKLLSFGSHIRGLTKLHQLSCIERAPKWMPRPQKDMHATYIFADETQFKISNVFIGMC